MNVILEILVTIVLFSSVFWSLLYQDKASKVEIADLIERSDGHPDATMIVIECLKNTNLQKRHYRSACKKIKRIVDAHEADLTIKAFKTNNEIQA